MLRLILIFSFIVTFLAIQSASATDRCPDFSGYYRVPEGTTEGSPCILADKYGKSTSPDYVNPATGQLISGGVYYGSQFTLPLADTYTYNGIPSMTEGLGANFIRIEQSGCSWFFFTTYVNRFWNEPPAAVYRSILTIPAKYQDDNVKAKWSGDALRVESFWFEPISANSTTTVKRKWLLRRAANGNIIAKTTRSASAIPRLSGVCTLEVKDKRAQK